MGWDIFLSLSFFFPCLFAQSGEGDKTRNTSNEEQQSEAQVSLWRAWIKERDQ